MCEQSSVRLITPEEGRFMTVEWRVKGGERLCWALCCIHVQLSFNGAHAAHELMGVNYSIKFSCPFFALKVMSKDCADRKERLSF